jgi:hypothetical protein
MVDAAPIPLIFESRGTGHRQMIEQVRQRDSGASATAKAVGNLVRNTALPNE